jgi:hypothetical protein
MRLTDLLKGTAETQIINQDGKRYEFTPGKDGSTIVRQPKKDPEIKLPSPPAEKAKVIGPEELASVGSVRG